MMCALTLTCSPPVSIYLTVHCQRTHATVLAQEFGALTMRQCDSSLPTAFARIAIGAVGRRGTKEWVGLGQLESEKDDGEDGKR